MLSNLLDKAVNPLGLRGIYSLFAALMCICAVLALFSDSWGTPLDAMEGMLAFFEVPTEWIGGIESYLGEDNDRNQIIGGVAVALGVFVVPFLSPNPGIADMEIPSVQSATWWICAAVCAQIPGISQWLLIGITVVWLLIEITVVWLLKKPFVGRWLSSKGLARRPDGWFALDIVQLFFVIPGILLLISNFVLMDVPQNNSYENKNGPGRPNEKKMREYRKEFQNTPSNTQQRVVKRRQKPAESDGD